MSDLIESKLSTKNTPISDSIAWKKLKEHGNRLKKLHISKLFEKNPNRSIEMEKEFGSLRFNYSREKIDSESFQLLIELARGAGLSGQIEAMFRGDKINTTEGRSVLHTALRLPIGESLIVDGVDIIPNIHAVLEHMTRFTNEIHRGERLGSNGKRIKHIVNIGIGGSDLGPAMAYQALKYYKKDNIDVHFVSSVDPTDLAETTKDFDPDETLFIICSKTFTTDEPISNANLAKDWILRNNPSPDAIKNHFVAVSTNADKVAEFGIDTANMFEFWDWVGGRFSISSAVGLSVMLGVGPEHFKEMLNGMHEMDKHYLTAPLNENLPIIMALMSIWNTNFLGNTTLMEVVYDKYLELLPKHLQQVLVESIGKSKTQSGKAVNCITSPLIMSVEGPNWQHSFGQGLHQGTVRTVAATFIGCLESLQKDAHEPHAKLLSHMAAQADSLAFGVQNPDPIKEEPGDIPSSILTINKLTPHSLGQIIALFEHNAHAQASILDINGFDQPGVEYGKIAARAHFHRLKLDLGRVPEIIKEIIRRR